MNTDSIRARVWPEDHARRWHNAWALIGAAYAAIAFLFPLPPRVPDGFTIEWTLGDWRWDASSTAATLVPMMMLVVLIATLRWSERVRGGALVAASLVAWPLCFNALRLPVATAALVVACGAAAAAHVAYRFEGVPRFRVPLAAGGVGALLVASLWFWQVHLAEPQGRSPGFHAGAGLIAAYGICLLVAAFSLHRFALGLVRWANRLLCLGLPLFGLALVSSLASTFNYVSFAQFFAIARAGAWIAACVVTFALGCANLGSAYARRVLTERHAARVFE